MSDEFHFTLTERKDKNNDVYLFAGLKMINSVLFIRPEPTEPGQPQRWAAILKPYRPRGDQQDDYTDPWTNQQVPNDSSTRK